MVGLKATSSKTAYATRWVTQVCCNQRPSPHGRSLLTWASPGDTQNTQRQVWLSLCGVPESWHTQGFVRALQESLAGMGFDSKCDYAPPISIVLLGLLFCPWMWGIFFFWWDPTFSCWWWFSRELQFCGSHRRRSVHVQRIMLCEHKAEAGLLPPQSFHTAISGLKR